MLKKPYSKHDAEMLMPLMTSIGREVDERYKSVARLEARLADLLVGHDLRCQEALRIESELSVHRRELRDAEKELSRFGCSVDADRLSRIVCPAAVGAWAYDLRSDGPQPETTPRKPGP